MVAEAILIVSEVVKIGISAYVSYMQQKGLTEDQINAVFDDVRKEMLKRDPSNIPN